MPQQQNLKIAVASSNWFIVWSCYEPLGVIRRSVHYIIEASDDGGSILKHASMITENKG